MGQAHKKKLTHVVDHLPRLTIAESGSAMWCNMWCGFTDQGQSKLVARKKIDDRFFNTAETDYHAEVIEALMDEFCGDRAKDLARQKERDADAAKAAPASADSKADSVAKPVKKAAKKTTKKKTSK